MINPEIINERLREMDENIVLLEELKSIPFNKFQNDPKIFKLAMYCLQISIQCLLDICHHIIVDNNWPRPKNNTEAIITLGEKGVVPIEFANDIVGMANLRNILVSLAPLACEKGVTICVENVWNRFLLSPVEMRRLVDEVGSPWVQSYLDTANMMAYGYPEQWIRELGPRIKRVHFKDFIRGEHRFVPLMDGDTDWAAVMKELRQAGYSSALVHEIDGDREVQIEMARRMRQIVAM